MNAIKLKTPLEPSVCERLSSGDLVFLSGTVYTARDVAHRRLNEAIQSGSALPVSLRGEVIFYAGPAPAPPGRRIGSIGPTTSSRMDHYTPRLLEHGLRGMIGKGPRSPEVREAIVKFKAIYFGALAGVAALTSRHVRQAKVVAYEDLGPEAVMRLVLEELPLIVLNDTKGGDFFRNGQSGRKHIDR